MKTKKHLIISGAVFTVVLILWPVFMSISQPQGTDEQQLQWLLNNIAIYKIQFFLAFLISPSIIYLIMAQLEKYPSVGSIGFRAGLVFLTGYFVLNTISYGSQMTYVPILVEAGLFDQAMIWYFGSSVSFTYFINQMGYCFWGIGVIILFFEFIKEKGMIKYISIIYFISGILSIIAFFGLIINNDTINSMTFVSGFLMFPVGILTLIWGLKENKKTSDI